jgi:sn-glycerol 3-phosphate transport system substrate-binding protein
LRRGTLVIPVLATALVSALGVGSGAAGEPGCSVDALTGADEPVEITFWHVQAESNERVLQELVDQFEASQDRVRVRLVNQVTYPDVFEKYRAALDTGDLPDLVQLEETAVQSIVDSDSTIPVGACAQADDYDLSDFLPRATEYFTTEDVLRAMPWTISNPILVYDKAVFRAAGLDPEKPPTTFNEITEYSRQIVESGASRHGIALRTEAYFNEFFYAKSGRPYVNHANGRDERATKARLDNADGREIWTWWDEIVESGLAVNTGSQVGNPDHLLAIANGDAGMTIDASGVLGPVFDVLSTGQYDHVEPGVAPLPALRPGGGVPVGDGSLWIPDTGDKPRAAAAWELMKFLSSPEAQAAYAVGSRGGFIPIRVSALDDPALQAMWAENPELRIPYDQLESGPVNSATVGSVIGDYQGVRDAVRDALTRMLTSDLSPKEALRQAQREATAAIEEYNDRVGA